MGKIRVKTLGDEEFEKEQKDAAKKRRLEKQAKKAQVKGVGLKGGQRIAVVEGVELKGEAAEAVAEMEGGQTVPPADAKALAGKEKSRRIKQKVHSKRYQDLKSQVNQTKLYSLSDAIKLVKKTSTTKFVASVDAHVNINPETLPKDKKNISGSVNLPHGTGKKRRIVIADDAILEAVSKGKIDFDVLVAHPSLMPKLAKVAKILGPKGLMPNPKTGTVSPDPEKRAKELEGGELNWKSEPDQPVIHQTVGKVSFEDKQLLENVKALTSAIKVSSITKLTLTSSMGPGIKVDINSL